MTCPGSYRIARRYRAKHYHPPQGCEGQCPGCGEWVPVDWNGSSPETGYRTLVTHEVQRRQGIARHGTERRG